MTTMCGQVWGTNLLQMVLQAPFSLTDLLDSLLEGTVHSHSLALSVLQRLVQNGINHSSERGGGIALMLCRHDVLVGEGGPLIGANRAGRRERERELIFMVAAIIKSPTVVVPDIIILTAKSPLSSHAPVNYTVIVVLLLFWQLFLTPITARNSVSVHCACKGVCKGQCLSSKIECTPNTCEVNDFGPTGV